MTAAPATVPKSKPSAAIKQLSARRHKWGQSINIHRDTTKSGCDETFRHCQTCGLIRITVHGAEGYPYRAWQTTGGVRFNHDTTPLCEGEPS